ncbi:MAG TPA: hypothetical protein VG892_11695 [Terriglobales bacterium]|jgi:hypothetical protein|nr:hypothetical protein [Terriglobales bacterium]
MLKSRIAACFLILTLCASAVRGQSDIKTEVVEYKVIATTKTSTTEKEMNEASDEGFRFGGTMGGTTGFAGSEVVTIMVRTAASSGSSSSSGKRRYAYRLLATKKTSTMQKELQDAGDEGYSYKGQTVYRSAFGGKEVVVILELDRDEKSRSRYEYLLLATKRTSTMQKELSDAGRAGYEFVGVTVGETAMGGSEVLTILRKVKR